MKLRTQILAFGMAGAALTVFAGGIGLIVNLRLGAATAQAIHSAEALQASQAADMMHDAVRGDSQRAMLGALEKQPEDVADARKELKAHAQTFHQALSHLDAMALSDPTRAALRDVMPLVERYLGAAEKLVGTAEQAVPGMRDAAESLQMGFVEVEDKMGKLSALIAADNQKLNVAAQDDIARSKAVVGITLLAALAAALSLSLWLARRLALPMNRAVDVAHRLAEGDLAVPIEPIGNDETVRLLVSLQEMRDHIAGIVRQVKTNADDVAVASAEIARGNQDLSDRTEQQAAALEQTAATMDQLGTTVRNNADSARQASDLATGASSVATQGAEVIGRMTATMEGINDSSRQIASIIGVIDGIAFQTNILALNAAVEAARAGEQGRGFAVVAAEVRMLAQRSATAAREVRTLVDTSVERVGQGSALAENACRTMADVVTSIQQVTSMVAGISAASAEQSAGVSQVGEAVSQMDQATQQNAALVEESAAAAESLRRQAQLLVQAVSVFRVGVAA